MEGILWVTREGVGEDNGGDPILSVQRKGCLSPHSPAAEKLSHRVEHHLLFQDHPHRQWLHLQSPWPVEVVKELLSSFLNYESWRERSGGTYSHL